MSSRRFSAQYFLSAKKKHYAFFLFGVLKVRWSGVNRPELVPVLECLNDGDILGDAHEGNICPAGRLPAASARRLSK